MWSSSEDYQFRSRKSRGGAIDAFGVYLESCTAVIALVLKGKSKARQAAKLAQDSAHEVFVVTGAVLAGTIVKDMAEGRSGFWQWFQTFYAGLDGPAKFTWADFAEVLLGESLQLWFAQQLADSPDDVERWRKYLSTDEWE